jgi:hypothetical protein
MRWAVGKDKGLTQRCEEAAAQRNLLTFNFQLLTVNLSFITFYTALAILITWPLVTQFSTHFIGDAFSDAYEYTRHIWWIKHALQTGQPIFDQPLLAYPDGLDGAWLWGNPLQSFPAWLFAFVMPLPAAYNLMTLLWLALNGWSMYWLVSRLTQNQGAALIAGVIFEAYPTFQGQLSASHEGLLVLWPVPFYVYALFRLRESGSWRYILTAGLLFVLSILGNSLLLVYLLLPITGLFTLSLLWKRQWTAFGRVILSAALGVALSSIFLVPIIRETLNAPDYIREAGSAVRFSADLLAIITPSFYHPLYRNLDYTHALLGVEPAEKLAYIGILPALLTLLAVWKMPAARWWLLLALIAWVLSLGPILKVMNEPARVSVSSEYESYVALPWLALGNLPLLNIARTPSRFNFALAFAVAVMAGYGVKVVSDWLLSVARKKDLTQRRGEAKTKTNLLTFNLLLTALILYDYQTFWLMPTLNGIPPEPIAALAGRDDIRAVFNIPSDHLLTDKEALFLQTAHQRPLIAGHVTRRTPVDPAKLTILQNTLNPALLDAAGADIVIVHKNWDVEGAVGQLEKFTRESLGEPFFEDDWYAAFEVPDESLNNNTVVFSTTALAEITDQVDSYLYAPETGWVLFSGTMSAGKRNVTLTLDGQSLQHWSLDGETAFALPLPITSAGYHTVSLEMEQPCAEHAAPTLRCRSVKLENIALADFAPAAFEPVLFDGLRLEGDYVPALVSQGDDLKVYLWWQFDRAVTGNDIRFVHVIDSQGNNAAQFDNPLGEFAAGSQQLETLTIPTADLPLGQYTVYTGWYSYPDLTRRAVLSDVPGVRDNLAQIGTFTLVK